MDLHEVQQQEEDGLAGVLAATEGALADPEARNGNRAQPRTARAMQDADSAFGFALFRLDLEGTGRSGDDLPMAL